MKTPVYRRNLVNALVLTAGLVVPLAGCGRQPDYSGEPIGVDRQARPQVIVKKTDVYIDGRLIRRYKTSPAEVKAWSGYGPDDQQESDAYWDKTGLMIHASKIHQLPGHPIAVHRVAIWLRRVSDAPGHSTELKRPCTPEDQIQHDEYAQRRLREIEEDDVLRGTSSDELKQRIRSEACIAYEDRPLHAFGGYLEADGLPLTANMSLAEIQVRRKRLGLPALTQKSGALLYYAPVAETGPGGYSTWEFIHDPSAGDSLDEQKLLKILWVP